MWENLSSDLLVEIFSRIDVADLVAGVPYVCSAWRRVARDPSCWRVLNFQNWYYISCRLDCRRDEDVDFSQLLDFAINRSEEVVYSVFFPKFADAIDLEYVANRCPMLQYFSMQNRNVYVTEFCKAIEKLEFLKGMAVDEWLICHQVLQHVNQCCNNFLELKVFSDTVHREMISAICECLPRLRKLELSYTLISRNDILSLLDGLKELEVLDISGLKIPGITSEVIEKVSHLKAIHWNPIYDSSELKRCSTCWEYYSDQTPCECMLIESPEEILTDTD